ncbi:MAG TPA: RNA polymerase sigma-70 factor [Gemmatimonadales bacterium]|nr:RNA polymerase sigma-70 factor [Gemmatimonadales bacterium]
MWHTGSEQGRVASAQHAITTGHMLDSHFRSSQPTRQRRLPPATPHSWESAFQAYYVELCEYVLRFVGSAEAAQDLVQDLFLRLWDSRGPRDVTRLTRPYLYVAARNRALKYLRHRRVVTTWIARAACEDTPPSDTPEDLCLCAELDDVVQRAIAQLPARCRAVFMLRRREQLSYREIATRLGVSLGTVKSQMWRATLRLRAKLGPYLARPAIPEGRAG